MSPQQCGIRFRGPQKQRGAIGLMAAVTLGMALLFMLLVVDSGRLYFEQRKLQRVADMAVLEAVTQGGTCASGTAATYANTSATRNGFTPDTVQKINTTCGTLVTGSDSLRTFKLDASKSDAIRVIATTTVPTSVAGGLWSLFSDGEFGLKTNLTASAVGARGGEPLAMLTIRSSLLEVNTADSPLLNPLIGGMLGGNLSLDVASWKGLASADVNLLSYLDQLAIDLKLDAGNYNQLLTTNVSATQLINAAVKVLEKGGPGATVALNSLKTISLIASNTKILKLGDLLNIQNGTPNAGLDVNLKALELLQGIAQLANGKNAVAAELESNLLGLIKLGISLKVIEPAQMSVVGNPALIKGDYFGPNKISVRTAQVQTRVHISLPILNTLQPLVSALSGLLSSVTEILKKLLKLDLVGVISCLLECKAVSALTLVSDLDIYLEAASANSYVKDYSCASDGSSSLTVNASKSAAKLSIGSKPVVTTPPANPKDYQIIATDSDGYLAVDPAKLIRIDMQNCVLLIGCSIVPGGGGSVNFKVQTKIASTSDDMTYNSPVSPTAEGLRDLKSPPYYQDLAPKSETHILKDLGATLGDKAIVTYTPPPHETVTSALLKTVADLINGVAKTLAGALQTLLGPLLDPIVDTLLKMLGVSLGNAEIGANLSCGSGGRAQLVL